MTDLESLLAQHLQAKAMAEQHGIEMAFEPFGTPHQAVAPGIDPMSAFTKVESTTVMAEE